MSDTTLIILAAVGIGVYFIATKPPAMPGPSAVPVYPGVAAGYQPPAGYPSDPGDRNSWAPAIAAGIGALGNIVTAGINASNRSTDSGYTDSSDY